MNWSTRLGPATFSASAETSAVVIFSPLTVAATPGGPISGLGLGAGAAGGGGGPGLKEGGGGALSVAGGAGGAGFAGARSPAGRAARDYYSGRTPRSWRRRASWRRRRRSRGKSSFQVRWTPFTFKGMRVPMLHEMRKSVKSFPSRFAGIASSRPFGRRIGRDGGVFCDNRSRQSEPMASAYRYQLWKKLKRI